eukprot:746551-Hanusia_phi.AAC.1
MASQTGGPTSPQEGLYLKGGARRRRAPRPAALVSESAPEARVGTRGSKCCRVGRGSQPCVSESDHDNEVCTLSDSLSRLATRDRTASVLRYPASRPGESRRSPIHLFNTPGSAGSRSRAGEPAGHA